MKLVRDESRKQGRTTGVYPETKHPTYVRSIGRPLEWRLLNDLRQAHLDKADDSEAGLIQEGLRL